MIVILYAALSELRGNDHLFRQLLDDIPLTMQNQVLRYKLKESQQSCLIGKILLRKGLDFLGMGSDHPLEKIQYTSYNKPFFPDSTLDFNLSHSGDYVVCALSRTCRLGIDLEHIRQLSIEDFTSQMREEEKERVFSAEDMLTDFYRYWTEKEAVIKADGKGLSIPLMDFSVIRQKARIEETDWFVKEISIAGEYICHLATDLPHNPMDIIVMESTLT